jgi:hypothetical protein
VAHFTSSGLQGVLDLFVDDFEIYLTSAAKLWELEQTAAKKVVILGYAKEGSE